MGKNTRYDKLRRKLNREFARGKTFTPAIAANSTELIFDLNDYEVRDADGYVRYLSVQNESANAIPEGEVLIQVGKEIDSTELDLIKMSGLLDLNEQ